MTFQPKKDAVYGIIIWLIPICTFLGFVSSHFSILIGVIFILALLLPFWLWNSTEYRLENGELIVKCWIFGKRVQVADIISVTQTKNLLSSYALSAERLELKSRQQGQFYIAPFDFPVFCEALQKENPNILIVLR
jgi:hypothetical protein